MAQTTHLIHAYDRLPVGFVRGEGARLWDAQGKRHLDALSGIAVCEIVQQFVREQ